ncbi:septum formation family protein [Arthrobacter sp. SW1]|uniref:septum formation family protein n=1 Tax=Arthrobacter sp. SW1 TaxID=1920889 RepID=UPI00209A77C2|nr:septum formation family protein [Arthrobacter sp. SW1]
MSFARMKGTDSDMGQENPSPYGSDEERSDAVPPAPATPPRGPRPAMDRLSKQRLIIGGIVLGVLLIIGISLWILLAALSNKPEAGNPAATAPASRGPLPADIEAKDYRVGDCFSDFDSNASKARAVDCTTPHSAQLGAVFNYKANDGFPGTNALRDKGRDVCRTVMLNEASRKYNNLLQQNVYPSSDSWNRGDRRVDCFIVVDSGNTLKESVLQK